MFSTYILQSLKNNRFYIGHTIDLKQRLNSHNKGKVKSTKNKGPWKIVFSKQFQTKNEANKFELKIKSYKGGKAFKKLINN
jgi:putative endonuclease